MDAQSFDAMSRRASLTTIGAAGFAALALPITAVATKNKKKSDPNKRCKKQAGACATVLTAECAGQPTCLDAIPCCDQLKTCNFGTFLACLVAASAP